MGAYAFGTSKKEKHESTKTMNNTTFTLSRNDPYVTVK